MYKLLKAAGVKLDSHESDLYCEATEASRATIAAFYRDRIEHRQITTFTSEGRTWYDIPFAYDPFWEARQS